MNSPEHDCLDRNVCGGQVEPGKIEVVKTTERWLRGVLQHVGCSGLLTKFTRWEVNAFWLFLRVVFPKPHQGICYCTCACTTLYSFSWPRLHRVLLRGNACYTLYTRSLPYLTYLMKSRES